MAKITVARYIYNYLVHKNIKHVFGYSGGALLPLLRRVIVPTAMSAGTPIMADDDFDEDLDKVEVQEGDTLEDIKAKLKPKKAAISAEMLDTANTYDDKVAVIRMIVGDQAGRVSNVFKNMMQDQPAED